MSLKLIVLLSCGLIALAEGRPQVYDLAGAAASGTADLLGVVSVTGDGLSDTVSGTINTFRIVSGGIRDLVTDTFRHGAETASRFTAAVQDTTQDATDGVSDALGATKTYFADGIRSGGRFATGAVQTGFGVLKDTVGAAGDFANDVRGSLRSGFGNAADALDDFAGDLIDNQVNFLGAATGVVENVATRGIENFSHVLVPSRF